MAFGDAATAKLPETVIADPSARRCAEDFHREWRRLIVNGLFAGFVVLMLALIATSVTSRSAANYAASSLLGGVCVFAAIVIVARRTYIPAVEMMLWQGDRQADMLAEIDGNREIPEGPEQRLERMAGRTGSAVPFFRVLALWELGRADEAKAALDAWRPSDSVDIARRERLASRVDPGFAEEHLASAEAAIDKISDQKERVAQHATLLLDTARVRRHEMWTGLDALVAARAELGRFYNSSQPVRKRPIAALMVRAAWSGAVMASLGFVVTETSALSIGLVVVLILVSPQLVALFKRRASR